MIDLIYQLQDARRENERLRHHRALLGIMAAFFAVLAYVYGLGG